ncbi:hypothetical protein OF83DRAFT_1032576, partial [Amylostereum chailletii]
TPNNGTDKIQTRYQELRRTNRQYRYLTLLKRFHASDSPTLAPGQLTLRCITCPQPGVNLEVNWK